MLVSVPPQEPSCSCLGTGQSLVCLAETLLESNVYVAIVVLHRLKFTGPNVYNFEYNFVSCTCTCFLSFVCFYSETCSSIML